MLHQTEAYRISQKVIENLKSGVKDNRTKDDDVCLITQLQYKQITETHLLVSISCHIRYMQSEHYTPTLLMHDIRSEDLTEERIVSSFMSPWNFLLWLV